MEHHILSQYHCALDLATQFTSLANHNFHWEAGSSPARMLSWLGVWVWQHLCLSIIFVNDWSPAECITRRVNYMTWSLHMFTLQSMFWFLRVWISTDGWNALCFICICWMRVAQVVCVSDWSPDLHSKQLHFRIPRIFVVFPNSRCAQFHSQWRMEFNSSRFLC